MCLHAHVNAIIHILSGQSHLVCVHPIMQKREKNVLCNPIYRQSKVSLPFFLSYHFECMHNEYTYVYIYCDNKERSLAIVAKYCIYCYILNNHERSRLTRTYLTSCVRTHYAVISHRYRLRSTN